MDKKIGSRTRKKQYQAKYNREFPRQWFQYCKEQLENIEGWADMLNDTSGQRWHLHHHDEISEDDVVVSRDELIIRGEYYNLTANKLIFMTESEHRKLHHSDGRSPMHGKTGDLSPVAKPIEVDGVPYVSRRAAAEAHSVVETTIGRWIKKGKAKYINPLLS